MALKSKTTPNLAEQLKRESQLRASRVEEMPSDVQKSRIEYNEDSLWIHPDRVFSNPKNSRKTFDEDELNALAESMKSGDMGVLEPIIVRERKNSPKGLQQYEVIAGDRRLAASKRAGLTRIPIIVRNVDDRTARRINLIENLHRSDLPDAEMGAALLEMKVDMSTEIEDIVEKARTFLDGPNPEKRLGEGYEAVKKDLSSLPKWMDNVFERAKANGRKPKVNWEDVAFEVDMIPRSVYYYVAAAKLPEDIAEAVSEMSGLYSRALSSLSDEGKQRQLLNEIRTENLTGEQAVERAATMKGKSSSGPKQPSLGGTGGNSSGARKLAGELTYIASLSELSRPNEQIRAAREARQLTARVADAVEGRVTKYGPFEAIERQELNDELKKLRAELERLERAAKPPADSLKLVG